MTPSPRRIRPEDAQRIGRALPPDVLRVGVFVDESAADIARAVAASEMDRIQVHAPPDPVLADLFGAKVLRAFRARDPGVLDAITDSAAGTFLLDTYSPDAPGGTGRTFDWGLARRAAAIGRLILAGGLTAANVEAAIRDADPWGVDVSTGVEESPGLKDPERIRGFIAAVRAADRNRATTGEERG